MGIEPTSAAWEAAILPLNHARSTNPKIALRILPFQDPPHSLPIPFRVLRIPLYLCVYVLCFFRFSEF